MGPRGNAARLGCDLCRSLLLNDGAARATDRRQRLHYAVSLYPHPKVGDRTVDRSVEFCRCDAPIWPKGHRWIGRTYVSGCLVGGLGALVAAFGTTGSPLVTKGFGLLEVIWILVNVQGWSMARAGQSAEHRA